MYSLFMANRTTPSALILDLTCEGPIYLCEQYEVEALTVSEFNTALRAFSAEAESHGCYNKLRGTFAFVDAIGNECEIEFRIDADGQMTQGRDLAAIFDNRAKWGTDNSALYTRASVAAA